MAKHNKPLKRKFQMVTKDIKEKNFAEYVNKKNVMDTGKTDNEERSYIL